MAVRPKAAKLKTSKKSARNEAAEVPRLDRQLRSAIGDWNTAHLQSQQKQSPTERPSSLLKRRLYELVDELVRDKSMPGALQLLRQRGYRLSAHPDEAATIFLALINAIPDTELARSEKHRYAFELAYAFRHRIPVELLIGFVLQTGAGKAIKSLVDDPLRTEPWFDPARVLKWGKARRIAD